MELQHGSSHSTHATDILLLHGTGLAGEALALVRPEDRLLRQALATRKARKQDEMLLTQLIVRCFGDKGDVEDITEGESFPVRHLQTRGRTYSHTISWPMAL